MSIIDVPDNIFNKPIKCFDDYIYNTSLAVNTYWEEYIVDLIVSNLKDNTDFLDIGANVGFITLGVLNKLKSTNKTINTIHCFECVNETFNLLSYNLRDNINVKLYPFTVSNSISLCNISQNKFNQGCNTIYNMLDENNTTEYYHSFIPTTNHRECNIYIPCMPLDSMLYAFTNKISVIKIDVEGFEINVIKGAKELILKHKPILIIEIWADNFTEIVSLLYDMGYHTYTHISCDDYIFVAN